MTKICTLCNFSTDSDYQWESHTARDDHRQKELEHSHAELLAVLEEIVNRFEHVLNTCNDGWAMYYDLESVEVARAAIARATNV